MARVGNIRNIAERTGLGRLDAPSGWGEDRWDEALARYWDEYDWIGTDTAARATALAPLEESPDAVALAAAGVSERLIEALEAGGRRVWLASQNIRSAWACSSSRKTCLRFRPSAHGKR